jgi:mRNA interferase MazF
MRDVSLQIGDVVIVSLPERNPQGREQEGERPCVIVAIPDLLGTPRFPLITVVPFTDLLNEGTTKHKWWVDRSPHLYPIFPKGTANLWKDCVALIDQMQAVDCRRIRAYCGKLNTTEYEPIQSGIEIIFGIKTVVTVKI